MYHAFQAQGNARVGRDSTFTRAGQYTGGCRARMRKMGLRRGGCRRVISSRQRKNWRMLLRVVLEWWIVMLDCNEDKMRSCCLFASARRHEFLHGLGMRSGGILGSRCERCPETRTRKDSRRGIRARLLFVPGARASLAAVLANVSVHSTFELDLC